MATVLVVDDHETIRVALSQIIAKMGHTALEAESGKQALDLMQKHPVDFVITDLRMEGLDGVAVLERCAELDSDVPVMIVTAYGTVETAVKAMKLGAYDFITKPFSPEVVRLKVTRALELAQARRARTRLEGEAEVLREQIREGYGELVGSSTQMQEVYKSIEKVAPTDATVLITGESGTGKELVARAVHQQSQRSSGPFIPVNCGALAEGLLESELFGHERGAFTGAVRRKLGRFELADGGTLFLDEISEVGGPTQVKLLRVLQEHAFERVGSEKTIKVDVRIIAATNRDLDQLVQQGQFRQDLYYRLMVVPVALPPLRQRRSDIAELCRHFIEKLSPKLNPGVTSIEDEALGRLMAYHWPGNVRELENAVGQALVFAEGSAITSAALPAQVRGPEDAQATLQVPGQKATLPEILEDLERQLILRAYNQANGVKTETARLLGIKTSALYYKLEKYGIG